MDNQIVKAETSVVLSPNKLVMALQGKKIKECTDAELAFKISACVEKSWFDLGLKQPSDSDMRLLKTNLMNECKMSFGMLTLDELESAMFNGVRGKYGEVFGLNVIQVAKWLSAYMTAMDRQDAKRELEKTMNEKTEPSADEKFTTGKQLCVDLFEKYKGSQQLDRTAGAVYEFVKQYELIHPDYRKGILKEALEQHQIEKQKECAFCMDLHQRRRLNAELELLKDNIEKDMLSPEQTSDVMRVAKTIALKNWFKDLVLEDTDFGELIEGKRNGVDRF